MKPIKKIENWFWDYTYKNWKLTPKSKNVLFGSVLIVLAGGLIANKIAKKK